MNYCKTAATTEDVLYTQVISYFNLRKRYSCLLTEMELRYFSEFVNVLRKVFKNEKKKNKVLFQARDLLLMSLDKQNGTEYYVRLKEIERNQLWQTNEQAFYERLCIIFDYAMECVSAMVVIDNIWLFLNKNVFMDQKETVIAFLEGYNFGNWPRNDRVRMEKFIKRLKGKTNVDDGIEKSYLKN